MTGYGFCRRVLSQSLPRVLLDIKAILIVSVMALEAPVSHINIFGVLKDVPES